MAEWGELRGVAKVMAAVVAVMEMEEGSPVALVAQEAFVAVEASSQRLVLVAMVVVAGAVLREAEVDGTVGKQALAAMVVVSSLPEVLAARKAAEPWRPEQILTSHRRRHRRWK